ncbi:MAG: adenylate/guanylate cyclase domain-containing protein [Rugosibacter sp.]|nr:adenylate/guanylate cyclase domain-containing protein [Rugosibacter sp.]
MTTLPRTSHSSNSAQTETKQLTETEAAYSRFVPRRFLQLLGVEDIRTVQLGQQVEQSMTILFSDIRDFTSLSESMSPQENFNFLNSYLVQMEPVITAHGGIIDKYIGDAIMALFPNSPDDALRCSLAMLAKLDEYNAGRERASYQPIKIGIGINTGIVILGTVGGEGRMDGTVIGDAVNLASRLERLTKEYEVPILISEYTLSSLENTKPWSLRFLDRTHVRGKHDNQSVYEVVDADPPALRVAKKNTLGIFQQALAHYHLGNFSAAHAHFSRCLADVPDDSAARAYLLRCAAAMQLPNQTNIPAKETSFAWHDEYALGIATLDAAHQDLFNDINSLIHAIQTHTLHAEKSALISPLLTQIRTAATHAFLLQEQIMQDKNYPFLELHTRQHLRFFDYLKELQGEIENDGADHIYLGFRVKNMLKDWLINHVLNTDRHFAHHLNGRTVDRIAEYPGERVIKESI